MSNRWETFAKIFDLGAQTYANENQLYLAFRPDGDTDQAISRMQLCVADLRFWLRNNKLKINDDETEPMVICSPSYRNKLQIDSISIGDTNIAPSASVRNIGVEFD